MAKETHILFVYDTELLTREEDDPNSAIIYFHPQWVSEQQKTALCGQLIGTCLCLKSLFGCPKVVSLQTGKFALKVEGRFILVVGTDRNLPDVVLEQRIDFLYELIQFYHKNLKSCLRTPEFFESFVKLLHLNGGSSGGKVLLKSNSDWQEAKRLLNKLKSIFGYFGGLILLNNKVVHTDLPTQLTKYIVLSHPTRLENGAEIPSNLEGVKLFHIYIRIESNLEVSKSVTNLPKNNLKHFRRHSITDPLFPRFLNNREVSQHCFEHIPNQLMIVVEHLEAAVAVILTKFNSKLLNYVIKSSQIYLEDLAKTTYKSCTAKGLVLLRNDNFEMVNELKFAPELEFLASTFEYDDIYLRLAESVVFAHRDNSLEAIYQELAPTLRGLPSPRDPLSNLLNNSKKRILHFNDF